MISEIFVKFIDLKDMRYKTLGDYGMGMNRMWFSVANMSRPAYMLAILCHELVEYFLCIRDQIDEKIITAFDISFETGRCHGEPGDDPDCPYRSQHQAATSVERAVIAAFDEKWTEYEDECVAMFRNSKG